MCELRIASYIITRLIAIEIMYQTHIFLGFTTSDVVSIDTGCRGAQVFFVLLTLLFLLFFMCLSFKEIVVIWPWRA